VTLHDGSDDAAGCAAAIPLSVPGGMPDLPFRADSDRPSFPAIAS